jgi:hypothetical protein
MGKKITLGSSDAWLVDTDIKTKAIDYLYSKLDLSELRYIILNNVGKLKYLQEHEHYVSPNFRGYNYMLLMLTINETHYCLAIDRKKLSYHKSQLDMKTIQVIQVPIKTSESIFKGTILNGKLIQSNNEFIFLIQDCFYLMGNKILDMDMNQKMIHLDTILKNHFRKEKQPYCPNFDFKLNKLYKYEDLEIMINNLPKLPLSTNGIIFHTKYSGVNIIHIEKKIDKVEIKSSNNEKIDGTSYHIIHDFVNFLKSRTYSYESDNKTKYLWLSRTAIPDVYDIAEKDNGEKLGIALIPNLKISQLCDELIIDIPVKFKCVYSNKFKKWIPLSIA